MMFLTAEFASTDQYSELQISFSVIPRPPWAASLWWCCISKSVIFPNFGSNIGWLHSLFRNDFSNLLQHGSLHFHPRMSPSRKSSFSCPVLCSNNWRLDFNYRNSSLKLRCSTIFTNSVFSSCSKLVLSRVALFTFLMMPHWLILDKIPLNLITSAKTLTSLGCPECLQKI